MTVSFLSTLVYLTDCFSRQGLALAQDSAYALPMQPGIQVFTSPIHWTKPTNFPNSATHALDFGPGVLSGISPFTARNFDGKGARVVVISERGKGDSELYDSAVIKREENWGERYAPRLIKSR